MSRANPVRLTAPLLDAIENALRAANAGDDFDGGDFDGLNREDFELAETWAAQERWRREARAAKRKGKP